MLEIWNFARSILFIYSFQKHLKAILCQQIFCWRHYFLLRIFQNFINIGPISNCYIRATNKGKNDIDPSLESSNIGLHIYNRHFRPKLVHWNESVYCTPIHRALKMRFNEGSGSFLRPTIPELWRFLWSQLRRFLDKINAQT